MPTHFKICQIYATYWHIYGTNGKIRVKYMQKMRVKYTCQGAGFMIVNLALSPPLILLSSRGYNPLTAHPLNSKCEPKKMLSEVGSGVGEFITHISG